MKLFLISIVFVACICAGIWQARGQTADVSATVQFSSGQSVTVTDFSIPIPVQPDELVNVTIQFSADAIGEPVKVEASDGGAVSVGNNILVVGDDGNIRFAFHASNNFGQNRIAIHGAKAFSLQFSVVNSN